MKTALVTGATSNLGNAITRLLVKNGYHVIACYAHQGEKAKELIALGNISLLQLDLTKKEEFTKLSFLKSLDLLVNNSGVFKSYLEQEIPLDQWDEVFSVNIRGIHLMVQHLIPALRSCKGSSIVNIASINALHPGFGMTVSYDASKGAVVSYTQSLASELGPAIRVNAVAPGLLDAPYLHIPGNEILQRALSRAVLKRLVKSEEVAQAVLFLSEDEAITGQTIVVDCGYLVG
ncbi:MAG: SDR family NAD(P)-dependent oxidoreductase [Sphaerochaetaceae bacterium]|jgi:NAD(P)-dependent dehydrogenase (short-subunit alcohol dehydrogenase family)